MSYVLGTEVDVPLRGGGRGGTWSASPYGYSVSATYIKSSDSWYGESTNGYVTAVKLTVTKDKSTKKYKAVLNVLTYDGWTVFTGFGDFGSTKIIVYFGTSGGYNAFNFAVTWNP